MKFAELKSIYVKKFNENGIEEKSDIDWIVVEITGQKRSMLPLLDDFSEEEQSKIELALEKRLQHIPLGLIFGQSEFYGRKFFVTNDTLIPRLDTEVLIEEMLDIETFSKNSSVLDIGTGSGAIAITLNLERGCKTYAVDISDKALEVARRNAENLGASVELISSDLFSNISELKVNFIVSNPPYICSSVIAELDKEVKDNEPILALDGGEDGLDYYRKIIAQAKDHLNKNGMLFFEIGYDQGKAVSDLMKADFCDIKVVKDYGDNDRVVYGRLKN